MSEDLIKAEAEIYQQCLAAAHEIAVPHVKTMKPEFQKSLTADGLLSFEHAIASTLYIERNRRLYGRPKGGGKPGGKKFEKFEDLPPDQIISTPLPFGKHKGKTLQELAKSSNEDDVGYIEYILDKWELQAPQKQAVSGLLTKTGAAAPHTAGNPFTTDDDLPF